MTSDSVQPPDDERWRREAEFFDAEYYDEGPLRECVIQRYRETRKPWLPAEFPFWVMGDVRDKSILEVGCGDGTNAILLALKGARVFGLDISGRAISIARKRAELHGVADRARFECAPVEAFRFQTNEKFDVICGWAVLHHLLPVLDSFLTELEQLGHEKTAFMFAEPVTLWKWLRRFRLMLPIATRGTPDERPLEPEDLAILWRHFPKLGMKHFDASLRVAGRLLSGKYEDWSAPARGLYDIAARFDRGLLNVPGLKGLGATAVFFSGMHGPDRD